MVTSETDSHATAWRRFTGVWPVLSAGLLLGALACLVLPGVRAQAELSLTRQDAPFVELSAVPLDGEGHLGTTCRPESGRQGEVAVVVTLVSHLDVAEKVDYQVRVTTPDGDRVGEDVVRRVSLSPGRSRVVVTGVRLPPDLLATIEVRLPDTRQYLLLHCDGE